MPNDKSPGKWWSYQRIFRNILVWSKKKQSYLAFDAPLEKENSAPHKDKQLLN